MTFYSDTYTLLELHFLRYKQSAASAISTPTQFASPALLVRAKADLLDRAIVKFDNQLLGRGCQKVTLPIDCLETTKVVMSGRPRPIKERFETAVAVIRSLPKDGKKILLGIALDIIICNSLFLHFLSTSRTLPAFEHNETPCK